MWNNVKPMLPGYVFDACNRAGRRPEHEIGCVQLSGNIVALWALRMSSDGRSQLIAELNSALSDSTPNAALASLNDSLCQAYPDATNAVELGVMLLNRSDHTLAVTAAGDFFAVLRTTDKNIISLDRSMAGLPLGMIRSMEYRTQFVNLAPMDSVVWISPYTMQIMSATGNLYGQVGRRDKLQSAPLQLQTALECITNDIENFIGDYDRTEDICIMCFQRIE